MFLGEIAKQLLQEASLGKEVIEKNVIKTLKTLDDTLSGEDSVLLNTWDEICIQVQYAHSFFWEAYDVLVTSIIYQYINPLDKKQLEAIWFQTSQAEDWDIYDKDDSENKEPPVNIDDCMAFLKNRIYGLAEEYSNKRIQAYLKSQG
jgi:hypothetical protein